MIEERVRKPCLGVVPYLTRCNLRKKIASALPTMSMDAMATGNSSSSAGLARPLRDCCHRFAIVFEFHRL